MKWHKKSDSEFSLCLEPDYGDFKVPRYRLEIRVYEWRGMWRVDCPVLYITSANLQARTAGDAMVEGVEVVRGMVAAYARALGMNL